MPLELLKLSAGDTTWKNKFNVNMDLIESFAASVPELPLDLESDVTGTLPTANGGTGASTASGARTSLGLAIGTDVQAFSDALLSIAGLTTAADRMIYTTAADTYATSVLTTFGRSLIDDANAAAARGTLGLGTLAVENAASIGVNLIADSLGRVIGSPSVPWGDINVQDRVFFPDEAGPTTIEIARISRDGNFNIEVPSITIGNNSSSEITLRGQVSLPDATSAANALQVGDIDVWRQTSNELRVAADIRSTSVLRGNFFSARNWGANTVYNAIRSNGTEAAETNVANNDEIAGYRQFGFFGGSIREAARLNSVVDGTPSGTTVPGRWDFLTQGTTGSLTRRMSIRGAGQVEFDVSTTFLPVAAASVPNNSIFLDQSDSTLKKKNNAGVVTPL